MSGALAYSCRPLPRRSPHGDRPFDLCALAARQPRPRSPADCRPACRAAGSLRFSPALWSRLFLAAAARPRAAACRHRVEGGPTRPLARLQSFGGLRPAGTFLLRGCPGHPAPTGGPVPRQVAATLRWSDRALPPRAAPSHALGSARLYPDHLGRVRLTHGPAPLPQEVWFGSG